MIKLKELLKEDDYLKDAMNNGKKILKNPEDIDYLEKDGSVKVRDVLRVIR